MELVVPEVWVVVFEVWAKVLEMEWVEVLAEEEHSDAFDRSISFC